MFYLSVKAGLAYVGTLLTHQRTLTAPELHLPVAQVPVFAHTQTLPSGRHNACPVHYDNYNTDRNTDRACRSLHRNKIPPKSYEVGPTVVERAADP